MRQTMPVLFVMLLLSLVAPLGYCAVTPGVSAFILKPDVSFGTVAEGNRVDHTFVVENRGDAPLHILRVQSG
jgi:hypothetical protein